MDERDKEEMYVDKQKELLHFNKLKEIYDKRNNLCKHTILNWDIKKPTYLPGITVDTNNFKSKGCNHCGSSIENDRKRCSYCGCFYY